MIKKEIINRLKKYTFSQISPTRPLSYDYGGDLYARHVFEEGYDIYINIHSKETNSLTKAFHGHDFFEMNYVVKGSCRQEIEDCSVTDFREGSFCILNPRAKHNISVSSENDIVLNIGLKVSFFTSTFWALLEQHEYLEQFFLDYFLATDKNSNYLLFELLPDQHIEEILEQICTEYLDRRQYSQLVLRCYLITLFTELIRLQTDVVCNKAFKDRAYVRILGIFQYLSMNYASATLISTAEHFHCHPNYLSAFIKKNTGKTFRSIVDEIKLSQANYYLLNTNMAIKDISERLGFSQLCNFYDFIRKHYGTTPLEYRRLRGDTSE